MDKVKELIINKTIQLVAKQGVSGTSIKDIANACHMGQSSLYHHFKNKYELMYAAIWHISRMIGQVINSAMDSTKSATENYPNIARAILKFIRKHPDQASLYFQLMTSPKVFRFKKKEGRELGQHCQLTGFFRDRSARGEVVPYGFLVGYLPLYTYGLLTGDKQQYDEAVIASLVKAITPDTDVPEEAFRLFP